jgi:hypothetical protein
MSAGHGYATLGTSGLVLFTCDPSGASVKIVDIKRVVNAVDGLQLSHPRAMGSRAKRGDRRA